MELHFETVTEENMAKYIAVGIRSYREHYAHLWENQDPSPFIQAHLTNDNVKKALNDQKQLLFLIIANKAPAGILNLTFDADKGRFLSENNLLLNKLYLLKQFSNLGIGGQTLKYVHGIAKKHTKDVVWLYAMQKGKPLAFYKKHGYRIIAEAQIELPYVLKQEKAMWLMAHDV